MGLGSCLGLGLKDLVHILAVPDCQLIRQGFGSKFSKRSRVQEMTETETDCHARLSYSKQSLKYLFIDVVYLVYCTTAASKYLQSDRFLTCYIKKISRKTPLRMNYIH